MNYSPSNSPIDPSNLPTFQPSIFMASSDSERELRDARGRDDAMRGVR